MKYDAVLIAGPTASGKSREALALAQAIGGAIINADSMQVYREAPILTAQPSDADKAQVPHLLYGHVGAAEVYSVGRWRDDAMSALAQVRAMRRVPIFVGGTGMYFSALTEGLADIPEIPADVREAARALLEEIGVEQLHARLMERDPLTASVPGVLDAAERAAGPNADNLSLIAMRWVAPDPDGNTLNLRDGGSIPPPLQKFSNDELERAVAEIRSRLPYTQNGVRS